MKVSIIGAGNVGATAAMKIAREGFVEEVVLLDVKEGVAEGKAMDIMQSLMMTDSRTNVVGTTGDYSKTANSDIVVITSGVPRKPGMTREELVGVNSKVMTMVLDGATKYSPDAIYVVVSNPMDTMTQMVVNYLGKENWAKVIGMGGILDTARFKYNILMKLREKMPTAGWEANEIEGFVIGGHGDTTMVPLVEKATANDLPLSKFLSDEDIADIVEKTMKGGAILTKMLGTSAWEAPAQGICETVKMIAFDENYTVASSVYREDFDLCIGSLVNIGENGIKNILLPSDLSDETKNKYKASALAIQNVNEAL